MRGTVFHLPELADLSRPGHENAVSQLRPPGEGPVDHQAHSVFRRRREHRLGSVEGRGHGFFDEAVQPAPARHHSEVLAEAIARENVNGGEIFVFEQFLVGLIGLSGKVITVLRKQFLIRVRRSDEFRLSCRDKLFEIAPDVVVMKSEGGNAVHGKV